MEEVKGKKKGIELRVFGVVLFLLGSLNAMLSWRGSFELQGFYGTLMVTGIVFFIIGLLRGSQNSK